MERRGGQAEPWAICGAGHLYVQNYVCEPAVLRVFEPQTVASNRLHLVIELVPFPIDHGPLPKTSAVKEPPSSETATLKRE